MPYVYSSTFKASFLLGAGDQVTEPLTQAELLARLYCWPSCTAGSGPHLVEVVIIKIPSSIFIACFSTT